MTDDPQLFSSTQATKLAGITFRQLDFWSQNRYVTPTKRAQGSGTQRGWTLDEVWILYAMGRLFEMGCSGDYARCLSAKLAAVEKRNVGSLLIVEVTPDCDADWCRSLRHVSVRTDTAARALEHSAWIVPVHGIESFYQERVAA